jgi:Holliday junction resolvase-like predicted endonuclease
MARTKKRELGDLGEDLAVRYLESRKYKILERNYLKPYGEIDIVAKKGGSIYFVEVKSFKTKDYKGDWFSHENSGIRAEDNIHPKKLSSLEKVISVYLLENGEYSSLDIKFIAIVVEINTLNKRAKIRIIDDVL